MPSDPQATAPHPADKALLDAYARHLATRPTHTRTAYLRDVAKLAHLAGDNRLPSLRAADVRRCLATLHARGLGGRSLARTLSAWRGFYRFLLDTEHGLVENPCTGLRAPRSPKRLPSALSPDEAVQLVAIEATDPAGRRDRALFELAYSSGLRLAELAGLDLGRVDLVTGEVRVWGKGAKERIVPVGRAARDAIGAWLVDRDAMASPGEAALFVGERGRRITARAIQRRLAQWAVLQGLGRHVHPHMLRHSFASHLLQSSGDLRAVQEMLGHASIASTQVYTHLDFQYLAKAYDAAHPRARKRGRP
ncbi:MAG: tyrosine recombinase XerC [Casimicrobiaceae bacterium]